MKVDVTHNAGFPLWFDPDGLRLETGEEMTFVRTARLAETLQPVLRFPSAVPAQCELYYVYYLDSAADGVRRALGRYGLTYTPVVLPPLRVGDEFVKTSGHLHPPIPGTSLGYPEMYTQIYGQLLLFLQAHRADPSVPYDCVLIEMQPGVTVTIPPGYAHSLINATEEPAVMAGLYSPAFDPDYTDVRRQGGLAYYVMGENGDMDIEPNPSYTNAPPLRRLSTTAGSVFAPPEGDVPLWTSYSNDPDKYAFLVDPEAVVQYFS